MRNPCKPDCPGRNATCHTECAEYRQFEAENALKRKERYLQGDVNGAVYEATRRMKRSFGKR